ncbi:hypothetical protein AKJ39_02605 [candidate division MSBL1 archaeon SCGC-AAA259J03]|uniref:Uncharacterized protein n=1 Tax=candidate division MSBL1 archaeon SCGC-AAA259J03 TaxID=1698269 RepID=A0A656YW64_9EURY|nr:hypothetical protein AKJ39_02605 [candidate division MSBL1 archaeon SCGC-AAA259J03]
MLDETNKKIQDKKPSEYLNSVLERLDNNKDKLKELMKGHYISKSALEYLKDDNFDEFIKEREKQLKEAIMENPMLTPSRWSFR